MNEILIIETLQVMEAISLKNRQSYKNCQKKSGTKLDET
jgi:hypothetical protein